MEKIVTIILQNTEKISKKKTVKTYLSNSKNISSTHKLSQYIHQPETANFGQAIVSQKYLSPYKLQIKIF